MTLKEKLSKIQLELRAPKSQYNSFGKYKYRNAEDILEAVKPLLKTFNILLTLSDELVNISERYYVKATAVVTDLVDKDIIFTCGYAREEENKKGMDASQITGASSSYARKYALNGLFLIDDTKDSDTTNTFAVDKETLEDKLKKKLATYKEPQMLDADKIQVRDEYVNLGLDKKEATKIIMEVLNGF